MCFKIFKDFFNTYFVNVDDNNFYSKEITWYINLNKDEYLTDDSMEQRVNEVLKYVNFKESNKYIIFHCPARVYSISKNKFVNRYPIKILTNISIKNNIFYLKGIVCHIFCDKELHAIYIRYNNQKDPKPILIYDYNIYSSVSGKTYCWQYYRTYQYKIDIEVDGMIFLYERR